MRSSSLASPTVQQLEATLQGGKTSVPLNFLHVVLGKDSFPSVTDRTLFYNTDDELKKILKQSQELPGGWDSAEISRDSTNLIQTYADSIIRFLYYNY